MEHVREQRRIYALEVATLLRIGAERNLFPHCALLIGLFTTSMPTEDPSAAASPDRAPNAIRFKHAYVGLPAGGPDLPWISIECEWQLFECLLTQNDLDVRVEGTVPLIEHVYASVVAWKSSHAPDAREMTPLRYVQAALDSVDDGLANNINTRRRLRFLLSHAFSQFSEQNYVDATLHGRVDYLQSLDLVAWQGIRSGVVDEFVLRGLCVPCTTPGHEDDPCLLIVLLQREEAIMRLIGRRQCAASNGSLTLALIHMACSVVNDVVYAPTSAHVTRFLTSRAFADEVALRDQNTTTPHLLLIVKELARDVDRFLTATLTNAQAYIETRGSTIIECMAAIASLVLSPAFMPLGWTSNLFELTWLEGMQAHDPRVLLETRVDLHPISMTTGAHAFERAFVQRISSQAATEWILSTALLPPCVRANLRGVMDFCPVAPLAAEMMTFTMAEPLHMRPTRGESDTRRIEAHGETVGERYEKRTVRQLEARLARHAGALYHVSVGDEGKLEWLAIDDALVQERLKDYRDHRREWRIVDGLRIELELSTINYEIALRMVDRFDEVVRTRRRGAVFAFVQTLSDAFVRKQKQTRLQPATRLDHMMQSERRWITLSRLSILNMVDALAPLRYTTAETTFQSASGTVHAYGMESVQGLDELAIEMQPLHAQAIAALRLQVVAASAAIAWFMRSDVNEVLAKLLALPHGSIMDLVTSSVLSPHEILYRRQEHLDRLMVLKYKPEDEFSARQKRVAEARSEADARASKRPSGNA